MAERRVHRILIKLQVRAILLITLSLFACQSTFEEKIIQNQPGVTVLASPTSSFEGIGATPTLTRSINNLQKPLATNAHDPSSETPTRQKSTALPIATPSPSPRHFPTLDTSLPTPPTSIPEPAKQIGKPGEVVNIALLGNDIRWAQGGRTDAIMLLSLNKESGEVSLLSIPRDLFVVIPGWTMNRINLALPHGHGQNYAGGGGGLLKDTIEYNLGISVDYYVRIGFDGFVSVIDHFGGVEVVVNCPITDWKLKSNDLDPTIEDNWMLFTLNYGTQHLDGETALWYVRSRRTSNDFDRGRRQQKLLRALAQQVQEDISLLDIPALWASHEDFIETDLTPSEIFDIARFLGNFDQLEVRHFLLAGETVRQWTIPATGDSVQLLDSKLAGEVIEGFAQPSALNQAHRAPVTVIVETNDPIMFRQVAENLSWYGFMPVFKYRESQAPTQTTIVYHGTSLKGAFPELLSWIFRQESADIVLDSDSLENNDYDVLLGQNHDPCLPYFDRLYGDYEEITGVEFDQTGLVRMMVEE
jgi:LCP family protein required for cell wall assembly